MQKHIQKYFVGIDLGTTHTVVAYADKQQTPKDIKLFEINQLIAPGQVAAKSLLPSVRYHPAESELPESDVAFSQSDSRAVIGEIARHLGAKTKGRLVTSAKSWLSHSAIDQTAAILPWGSADGIEKVSPVEASASYLQHIRTVWGQYFSDAPLEQQDIVITVPASFDEAARSLTLEAAKMSGLQSARLLEEPQAVCYDWLHRTDNVGKALANVKLLLVCDIGGGTTDLTLIKIDHREAEPKLTRIAVGDHIMLGGDNIDLALTHVVESRLVNGESRLSAADLSFLLEQCRIAKERLLMEDAPERLTITVLGGGSKLIGGARSTYLTRDEVRAIALDGFFPLISINDLPARKSSGLVEFGLPYAAEPAISKHIAAFITLHQTACSDALNGEGIIPDGILLNGGLFRSRAITQRLLTILNEWQTKPVEQLENRHPEYAVAFGAVSYAIARHDKKLKIGGGAARSYFLRVDLDAVNENPTTVCVCVLPKGSEEGQEIILPERRFALRTGQPVRFDLVSYSGDSQIKAGDIKEITDDFHVLPPMVVAFDDHSAGQAEAIVELGITQTDLGTLKIQCIACATAENQQQQRWDVEFQIRKQCVEANFTNQDLPQHFHQAAELIQAVFGPKSKDIDPKSIKSLRNDLEKRLGSSRDQWHSALLRALFTEFWQGSKYRRRSVDHERLWLSLSGFCLRPGFGYPLDDWRIEQLWKTYPQGLQFTQEIQNWSEWWTLWRRVAGGLDAPAQEQIFADIANYLNPASARQPNVIKQLKQRSYEDMVRLAAVLERLPVASKVQLGEWLLKRLEKISESRQTWWTLGRVGARIPFYASAHNVISAETVSKWLELILQQDWKKNPEAAFAATLIARNSADRVRDIDEALRIKIIDKLKTSKSPGIWLDLVEHYKELDEKEENQFFGEALPPGLRLI